MIPAFHSHPPGLRIVIAITLTISAIALQLYARPYLPPLTWLLLYPATFLSAWYGGLWAGLLATALAALAGFYFFIPEYNSWVIADLRYSLSILIFVSMGVTFSWLSEQLRR